MRTRVYIVLVVVCLLSAGCSALQVKPSQIRGDRSAAADNASTAASMPSLPPPLEEVWKLDVGAGFGPVSPIIADEIVFVATRKGEVHAVELETGRRVGQATFGESIEGTPALADGMLFVPVGWGRRALIAFNLLRGSSLWKADGAGIEAAPVAYANVVIAADEKGIVRSYAKSDGKVEWETDLGEGVGVKASLLLANGLLIVADDQGRIAALNPADGSPVWSNAVGAPVLATPGAAGDAIYVATTRGTLVKLRADDGKTFWTYSLESPERYFASPAVSDGQVVFGSSDGEIRALDAETGSLVWSSTIGAAITAPPLLTADVVYVGSMRSELIALDRATGEEIWTQQLDGRVKSGMAAHGNRLVVLSEPKTVYMFESTADSYALGDD